MPYLNDIKLIGFVESPLNFKHLASKFERDEEQHESGVFSIIGLRIRTGGNPRYGRRSRKYRTSNLSLSCEFQGRQAHRLAKIAPRVKDWMLIEGELHLNYRRVNGVSREGLFLVVEKFNMLNPPASLFRKGRVSITAEQYQQFKLLSDEFEWALPREALEHAAALPEDE